MPTRLGLLTAFLVALAFTLQPTAVEAKEPPRMPGLKMEEAWPDVEFTQPIRLVNAGDGSDRLFVVEKPGRILVLPKWRGVGPVAKPQVFLDWRKLCVNKAQGGVLGLAFHPAFKTNGRAFVSYLASNKDPRAPTLKFKLVVAEVAVRGDAAVSSSRRSIIEIPKKFPIHQAGHIAFGPDGMLYVGVGDGGSKNDKDGNAQNATSLLGKILRLDVDRIPAGKRYGIADNPWPRIPTQVRPEIWAFGMRNPWHFAWDSAGRMWTVEPGTTGPESREWIMQVMRAGNHGWPYFEGRRKLSALPPTVKESALIKPVFEWVRGPGGGGTAGVGGFTYRGARIPALRGKYVFGDHMQGLVFSVDLAGASGRVKGMNFLTLGDVPDLSAIGEDEQGELYFCSFEAGMIFTLAPK